MQSDTLRNYLKELITDAGGDQIQDGFERWSAFKKEVIDRITLLETNSAEPRIEFEDSIDILAMTTPWRDLSKLMDDYNVVGYETFKMFCRRYAENFMLNVMLENIGDYRATFKDNYDNDPHTLIIKSEGMEDDWFDFDCKDDAERNAPALLRMKPAGATYEIVLTEKQDDEDED